MQALYVGVDGGGTKCVVRVEDENGHVIGRMVGGPANIRVSVSQAWHSIRSALLAILQQAALAPERHAMYVGMGLAGCEIDIVYREFLNQTHDFRELAVTSDAHIACLGAHAGQDGAIVIAGTGTVGYQVEQGQVTKVGGWGFPYGDEGSGAWLGLKAVTHTLHTLDGREPTSALSQAVIAHFHQDSAGLLAWANAANSTGYAELAPLVVRASESGDISALAILREAAAAIEQLFEALRAAQVSHLPLPCALVGGIAPFIQPHLSTLTQSHLRAALATPDSGAITWIREILAKQQGRQYASS